MTPAEEPPVHRSLDALTDDARWSKRLQAGDTAALADAYRRHERICNSLARRILRDPGWAEEVVQDVFVDLWRHPARYEASQGSLRTWLLAIAHHKSVDRVRWLRSRVDADVVFEGFDLRDARPGPEELAIQRERARHLHDALDALPEAQRQALILAYFEGHTQQEIAELLDWPLGTVKSRCAAGMKKLAVLLGGSADAASA